MNRKRIGWLSAATVVVAAFVVAITLGGVLNNEQNPGAKVAEAAGRVDRQVDDTQAAFADIKELILDNQSFEKRASQHSVNAGVNMGNPLSQSSADPVTSADADSAGAQNPGGDSAPGVASPGAGRAHIDLSRGINPASASAPVHASTRESGDADDDGNANLAPRMLTFNQKAREV